MTFELTPIVGSTFGGYQFKIRHGDHQVLKRVKTEIANEMRQHGYGIDNVKGSLEK